MVPLLRIIGWDFWFELIEPQIRVRDRVEGWEWWRIVIPQSGRFIGRGGVVVDYYSAKWEIHFFMETFSQANANEIS